MKIRLFQASIFLCILFSTNIFAICTNTFVAQVGDDRTALIKFGTVNVASTYLQPVGTLLASAVVPSTNYTFNSANASSVLWICDEVDLPLLQFLVATNGDDRVGGYWDLGRDDGVPDTFATYFQYVGIKQSMSGVTLSRFWKAVPVSSFLRAGNNKIHIRLQDIPPLYAELYRISRLAPTIGSGSSSCGATASGQIASGIYSCLQPNSYIQLRGPGLVSDNVGEDSNIFFRFWPVNNGFGYGMRNVNTLLHEPTCVARNVTPFVLFKAMSISELNNNQVAQSNFNVFIECSTSVNSGTAPGQTAIGFQVSEGALTAATNLGLVNSNSGVSTLLSDRYGTNNIAKGVGIYLSNANTNETMNFISQPYIASGALSGWYPVLSGVTGRGIGSTESGYTNYVHTFTATLKKLTGTTETVTAGQVRSTAYVLVKVQ
ncbi:adhesin [Acinetobacter sp. ANC 4558]|uniref:fimbrial protein n=1 Tax=Acinetobacter sp. ANC 4558 TaxID=1977876 RepID=UPI000A33A3D3|nr:fimbrial protein [Acinetobacter sp. ANC 4558]OTG87459.1 adhesin [Acinetobacter sp. ANC 4558]